MWNFDLVCSVCWPWIWMLEDIYSLVRFSPQLPILHWLFTNLNVNKNHLYSFKNTYWWPCPKLWSARSSLGHKNCITCEFPDRVDAAGPRTAYWQPLPNITFAFILSNKPLKTSKFMIYCSIYAKNYLL